MNRRGLGGLYQRGTTWWIHYSYHGKPYRESSGSTVRSDAVKLLRRRMAEMGKGQLVGPDMDKTTFEDLATILLQDYRVNERRSAPRMQTSLTALRGFFGTAYARDLTFDRFNHYIAAQLEADRAPASIRYDLAMLRRAFRLAHKAGKAVPPLFPTIQVSNVRTGFFEREDFEAVRQHLPDALKPVVTFAYLTGWRTRSEILPLQWKHVDFNVGVVRLEPGHTRNNEGRTFPFGVLPELAEVLLTQKQRTKELQVKSGTLIPWVFHRNGRPIKDLYGSWDAACAKAGIPDRIPHDFRRTAVRNLERAGVSRSVAMQLTGHRTASVYQRYAIASEADLSEGLRKLAVLSAQDIQKPRTVTVLSQFPG